jgi:hypothetical protein
MIYSQLCDLSFFFAQDQIFSKIHKTDKKILGQNKTLLMINDKQNTQVSTISM